jgi:hypothetical protein
MRLAERLQAEVAQLHTHIATLIEAEEREQPTPRPRDDGNDGPGRCRK